MASTIAGLLMLALFLSGSLITFRSTLFGDVAISGATTEASNALGDRARTVITIDSIVGDGQCGITALVTNSGATRILDLELMDVIVQFSVGNNAAQRLDYAAPGPPALGQWSDTALTGTFEPGFFNPGESLTIFGKAVLVEPGNGTVTIGAPNGVTDSAEVSGLNPCP